MTTPIEPPEGYTFINSGVGPFCWDDPNLTSMIVWADPTDQSRVIVVHEACGCFVPMGNIETHDAWHTALGG